MTGEDIFVHFYHGMGQAKPAAQRIYEHVQEYFFPIVQAKQSPLDRKTRKEAPESHDPQKPYTPYATNGQAHPPRRPPPPPPPRKPPVPPTHTHWH